MINQNKKYVFQLFQTLKSVSDVFDLGIIKNDEIKLIANNKEILRCTKDSLDTIVNDHSNIIFTEPSALIDEDEFLEQEIFVKLLKNIKSAGKLTRLNHVGFYIPVDSTIECKKNLMKETNSKGLKLYELESGFDIEWLFVGDKTYWRDPMLEFLPTPSYIKDKEIDYWLPSVHINIDTELFYEQIKQIVDKELEGKRVAVPIYYKDFVSQVRIWRGVISGINLHIDLNTSAVNTRYTRRVLLEEIKLPELHQQQQ